MPVTLPKEFCRREKRFCKYYLAIGAVAHTSYSPDLDLAQTVFRDIICIDQNTSGRVKCDRTVIQSVVTGILGCGLLRPVITQLLYELVKISLGDFRHIGDKAVISCDIIHHAETGVKVVLTVADAGAKKLSFFLQVTDVKPNKYSGMVNG